MHRFFFIVCLAVIAVSPINRAHAFTVNTTDGLATSITGIVIEGDMYDVFFHRDTPFYRLWDVNTPENFMDHPQGALLSGMPLFLNDVQGAQAAAVAISSALGNQTATDRDPSGALFDGFFVPFGISSPPAFIAFGEPDYTSLQLDNAPNYSYLNPYMVYVGNPLVSFQESSVPVPATAWLLFSGLLCLVNIKRKLQS